MGCCKHDSPIEGVNEGYSSILDRIWFFIIGLIVITMILPIIWGVFIYFLYNTSIKNKATNILPAIILLWNKILNQDKNKLEYEDESYEDDDSNYELLDYEKIE